jgi:hypothetical protein
MMRVDVTRMPASAALRLGLLAAFLSAAGCESSPGGNKSDAPSSKASLEKARELYKAKSPQLKKEHPAALKRTP